MSSGGSTTPDPESALHSATQLPPAAETHVILFTATDDGFRPFRLNPTTGLANEFRQTASTFAQSLMKRTLVGYSAGRKPDSHELVWLKSDSVPTLPTLVPQLQRPTDWPLFDPDARDARGLRFFVVSVRRIDNEWSHSFRYMSIK